jgi:hemerythrin
MKKVEWSEGLEVGHEGIDFEHKVFVNLINNLAVLCEHRPPYDEVLKQLLMLENHASNHFSSEEAIMLQRGLLEYETHQKIHRYLLDELKARRARFERGEEQPAELAAFLIDWFLLHASQDSKQLSSLNAKSEFARNPVADPLKCP